MNDRFFLDTNVFVYSFDPRDKDKQKTARRLIHRALESRQGVISTQVAQEFLNVATRKFSPPMAIRDASVFLGKVLEPLCGVFPSIALLGQALDISEETGYGFYDSLVVAGAVESECGVLYSEDLQNGRVVRGTEIRNPFGSL